MSFRLPKALQTPDDTDPRIPEDLPPAAAGTPLGTLNTGARFDGWDSLGSRDSDLDRFTADDLAAVTFMALRVRHAAAT
jgi:hypothetical protein